MKQEEIDKLESKKQKLEAGKAHIGADGVISYGKDKDGDILSDDSFFWFGSFFSLFFF